jgi:hypothetical protein
LTQTCPDGQTITNAYTAQGWLSGVATSQGGTTLASNLGYTGQGGAFGEVTAMHLGGGYDYSASYDVLDRAFDLKTKRTSDGTVMFDQSRTFTTADSVVPGDGHDLWGLSRTRTWRATRRTAPTRPATSTCRSATIAAPFRLTMHSVAATPGAAVPWSRTTEASSAHIQLPVR